MNIIGNNFNILWPAQKEKPHQTYYKKYKLTYRFKNFEAAKENILLACISAAREGCVDIKTKISSILAKVCNKAIEALVNLYKKLMNIILNIGNGLTNTQNSKVEDVLDISSEDSEHSGDNTYRTTTYCSMTYKSCLSRETSEYESCEDEQLN